jgi:hypothetical protein
MDGEEVEEVEEVEVTAEEGNSPLGEDTDEDGDGLERTSWTDSELCIA